MTIATNVDQLPVPSRGLRPRNRRELALVLASELFHARGFGQVSMNDLAAGVGVGPSALYRHFSGKAEMLRIVVIGALEVLAERCATEDRPLNELVARTAVLFRRTGLLVRRERAYLDEENLTVAQQHLTSIDASLGSRLRAERPGLPAEQTEVLAAALLAVGSSRSYVPLDEDPDGAMASVAAIVDRLLTVEVPAVLPLVAPSGGPGSRREVLLRAATRLFAEKGYDAVSINDIRAAAGSAASAVYEHLGTKADVLHAACMRGIDRALHAHTAAIGTATDPGGRVGAAVAALAANAVEHPDLGALGLVEGGRLTGEHARLFAAASTSYAEEWDLVLAAGLPDVDRSDRSIRLVALLVLCAELPLRFPDADLTDPLTSLGSAILGLDH